MSKFRPKICFARWRVAARTPRSKVTVNASASASGDASAGAPSVICTLRSKVTVVAPPGKLDIHLSRSRDTTVSKIRTSSVLADQIFPGDRIVSIDGEDVGMMNSEEIVTIMEQKKECKRVLVLLREQCDRDRVKALANQNATLQVQVEETTKERDFLLDKCKDLESTIAELLTEDDPISYKYNSDEESAFEAATRQMNHFKEKLYEAKVDLSELRERLSSSEAELAGEAEKRDILAGEVQRLTKENQQLRQEVQVRKAQWQQQCIIGDD